jgi:transposase
MITGWVINGIFFRTRTGCPWRDLPGCFGNWKTVYNGIAAGLATGSRRWCWTACGLGCGEAEGRAWTVAADATVVRAHQHAAEPGASRRLISTTRLARRS